MVILHGKIPLAGAKISAKLQNSPEYVLLKHDGYFDKPCKIVALKTFLVQSNSTHFTFTEKQEDDRPVFMRT